ncbi:MAG: hypothetical protein KDJ15_02790 [Alphaproteobacteria bacterium]|nr:hypothetical protein [Alphaproteobacteria bacterium]
MNAHPQTILDEAPDAALKELIVLTEKLIELMEEESRAMATGDSISFMAVQGDKEKLAARYQEGAREFHDRLEDFRGAPSLLLNRLEAAQNRLGAITRQNTNQMKPRDQKEEQDG